MENEMQKDLISENEFVHNSYLSDEINNESNIQISIEDLEPTFKKSSLRDYLNNACAPKLATNISEKNEKWKDQKKKSNSNLEITIIDGSNLSLKQHNQSNEFVKYNSTKISQDTRQNKHSIKNTNIPHSNKIKEKQKEVKKEYNESLFFKSKKKELKNDIVLFLSGTNKGSLLRALSSSRNSKEIFPRDILKNRFSVAESRLKSTEENTNKLTTCSRITSHKKRMTENFDSSKEHTLSFDQFYENQIQAQSLIRIKNLEKSIMNMEFPRFRPIINANSRKFSKPKLTKENSNSCDPPKKKFEFIKEIGRAHV